MKKILLVIDYQNDFVTGPLGFQKAVDLEDDIAQKIREYRRNGDEIAYTLDTLPKEYANNQEECSELPLSDCTKETEGWLLYGKIATLCDETDHYFEKNAYGSLELADFLANHKYDSVEVAGVISNICVFSNAVLSKVALPKAEIVVDASCTASNDDQLNEEALNVMESLKIKVTNRRYSNKK
ncbi:cysteine hydrolase family protein [Acetobacterium bakii]|uniref:Isochorismatase n=1 Tax=Acetobacterium bakii TaxID=52689 RepID=A0A0L6U0H9_9FIRM|nr:isochorismatase family cysteine hydrolase [Acetobacterium bakii]KNZ41325.1 isochorismatase [Acetobacterium bakii]